MTRRPPAQVSPPDVVYVVKRDPNNVELRHSLRSLANLPHGTVWIAGYMPPWVTGVSHIPVDQAGSKYQNSTGNLRAACTHPGVSERFTFMNDDFFVMGRVAGEMPMFHRGPVADVLAYYHNRYGPSRQYLRGMAATAELLAELGHPDPLSYELHVPIVVDKTRMLETLDVGADIPVLHKRTLYGNLTGAGGTLAADVKVRTVNDRWDRAWPFLSTSKTTFHRGKVGAHIRAVFDQPGPYETTVDAEVA